MTLCERHINPVIHGNETEWGSGQELGLGPLPLWFCFVQPFPPGEAAAFLLPLSLALFITTSPLSRECLISWRVNSKSIIAGEIKEGEKAREGGAKTQDTKKVGRSRRQR